MTKERLHGLAATLIAAICSCAAGAETLSEADLARLRAADVVILGEVHDNPAHHLTQAVALAAIRPKALVFEMLSEDQAARLRPEHFGSAAALAAVLEWVASGWPDFAMYYPVFLAAREAAVVGGGMDRADVRRTMTEGAAAVYGSDAAVFGLDTALTPAEQAAREALQMEAHCDALPEAMLPGMVEAQRLRDAGLARAVLAAVDSFGVPVAVIAGNGHARRDWGVPAMLRRVLPDRTIVSLGQFEVAAPDDPPYDLWLVTEAAERTNPCDVFRQ